MHKTGSHASDYGCHSFNLGLKLQMPIRTKDNFLYSLFPDFYL